MTELVNAVTGEVVEIMTKVEAERVTARIADKLDTIADNLEQVMPLIQEALTREAWRALGYASPTAYVSDRFKGALTRLPREIRQPVVVELSAAGMSTRAIAPIVGTGHKTVARDLEAPGVSNDTPEPGAPALTDEPGRTTKLTGPNSVHNPGPVTPSPRTPVTGMDGKTYTRPNPKPTPEPIPNPTQTEPAARRKPLPDTFWTTRYDLTKKAEALHQLIEDDRFSTNKEKIAEANLNDLLRSRDLLHQVIDQLTKG